MEIVIIIVEVIIYALVFLLGSSFASYINATIYRLEEGMKFPLIISQKSFCENCKKHLTWYELFPVLGYILLKGKCSSCKKKIDIYYPVSEFLLGFSALLLYTNNTEYQYYLILLTLFALSAYDRIYYAVPKQLTHFLLLLSAILFLLSPSINLTNLLLPLFFLLLGILVTKICKKSFGFGDILILFTLGIHFEPAYFLILFFTSIYIALLYSIIYAVSKRKKIRGLKIPMIPFISISFVITLLYGSTMIELLLKILVIW